jgi:hypothetical protein
VPPMILRATMSEILKQQGLIGAPADGKAATAPSV